MSKCLQKKLCGMIIVSYIITEIHYFHIGESIIIHIHGSSMSLPLLVSRLLSYSFLDFCSNSLSLFFIFCWCDISIVLGCSMDQLSVISFDHLFSSDFLHGALFYLQLSTFFCLHGLWGLLSALDVLPMRPLVRRCEINCLCVSPRRQSSPATRETGLR